MAEIKMEKKESGGMGWLWVLIALILLALLAWWLWPEAEVEEPLVTATEIEAVEPLPEIVPETPELTLSQIVASPAMYVGQTYDGVVRVTEVPTDRGFWVESDGARVFAILIDQPQESSIHIQQNTTIRMEQATVRDQTALGSLEGAPLDAATEEIIRNEQVFLMVDEDNIQMPDEMTPSN